MNWGLIAVSKHFPLEDLSASGGLNALTIRMKDGIKRMVHNLKQSPHPQGVAFS